MKLLDLFCGAGGCATGYHRAGFDDITGVDAVHMPRYPFRFVQSDAIEYLTALIDSGEIAEFDLIHASPPCQRYSVTASLATREYPDLVEPVRNLLMASGKPFVIENVVGAPLFNPLLLCGTMFPGLLVRRHRLFECRPPIWFPPAACCHWGRATGSGSARNGQSGTNSIADDKFDFVTVVGNNYLADEGRMAMGIDWMIKAELSQAIPPAYTEYIGRQMLKAIE